MERRTFLTGIAALASYATLPSTVKPTPAYSQSRNPIPILVDIGGNKIKSHRVLPDLEFDPRGNLDSNFVVKGQDKEKGLESVGLNLPTIVG